MEPVGPAGGVAISAPSNGAPPALLAPSLALPPATSMLPQFAPGADLSTPGHRLSAVHAVELRSMFPWRLLAAGSIAIVFALSALQVERILDGGMRSNAVMAGSIIAGVVAAAAV